jgi:hypothetical protein
MKLASFKFITVKLFSLSLQFKYLQQQIHQQIWSLIVRQGFVTRTGLSSATLVNRKACFGRWSINHYFVNSCPFPYNAEIVLGKITRPYLTIWCDTFNQKKLNSCVSFEEQIFWSGNYWLPITDCNWRRQMIVFWYVLLFYFHRKIWRVFKPMDRHTDRGTYRQPIGRKDGRTGNGQSTNYSLHNGHSVIRLKKFAQFSELIEVL